MIGNASFQRKIVYGVLIAVLLIPISFISRPSTRRADGSLSGGGTLAQMRLKHELSQAELGEIDPTSESMKLATLGMRGVAANLLWSRADKYKTEKDWDSLAATLNQIAKLQPNFLSVWQFQSWNMSYNVSVEFDDYHSRYEWVKKGISFLQEGIEYNIREPVLYWEMGWMFGHKIGKADERLQYRRLFRDDEDFHNELRERVSIDDSIGVNNKPDNWLVGRQWFKDAQEIVDSGIPIRGKLIDETGRIKRGKNPVLFHSHPPKWLMNYANAIETEGILGEKAQIAWRDAGEEWTNDFGNRELGTEHGFTIRLNGIDDLDQERVRLLKELDEKLVGVRERLVQEKRDSLSEPERTAWDTPAEDRNQEQRETMMAISKKMEVTPQMIADAAPSELRNVARRSARRIEQIDLELNMTDSYRDTVAYDYWRIRCIIEQTDRAIRARQLVADADKAYEEEGDLITMREKYEKAWVEWGAIYNEYPAMVQASEAEDIYDAIMRYKWVVEQDEGEWPPKNFVLNNLLAYYDESFRPNVGDENAKQDSTETDDHKSAKVESGNSVESSNDGDQDSHTENENVQEVNSESHAPVKADDNDATTEKPVDDSDDLEIPE